MVLIPPPSEGDTDETWRLFAELLASDVELLNEIIEGNPKIASLDNQQVRYFKELMTNLNDSICSHNIDKIFQVFEVPICTHFRVSAIKRHMKTSTT